LPSQVKVQAALDDTEEVLALWVFMGFDTAIKPAHRALHSFLHTRVVGRGGDNDIVELHHDVGANRVLQRHGVLRGKQHGRAVVGAEEPDTLFGDFGELQERDHLEAGGGISNGAGVD
jgi:hypothetical protein